MMIIEQILANTRNYGGTRNVIKYIVVHYTANVGDTAKNNCNYFKNNVVTASAHYFVDENSIFQSVPDNYIGWSVGGNKYINCETTGGGDFYGICNNSNSISIELCDSVLQVKGKTWENSKFLIKKLMKKYNVPIENVIRHFDVTGKNCPKPFAENKEYWLEFKNSLKEESELRYNKISELPDWARDTIRNMVENGKIADENNLDLSLDMIRILVMMNR